MKSESDDLKLSFATFTYKILVLCCLECQTDTEAVPPPLTFQALKPGSGSRMMAFVVFTVSSSS